MAPLLAALAALVALPAAAATVSGDRPPVAAPEKGLTVLARYVYYAVQGRTAEELRADLDRDRPIDPTGGRFDALTSWFVSWRYSFRSDADACAIDVARVSVRLTFRLPRWQRPAGVPRDLVSRWTRYLQALRRHEEGHAANGVATGRTILLRLRRLPPGASCVRLEKSANAMGAQEVARGNARDRAYDARTGHGAAQGAVFP